jgi:putative DNA primase/helicase
MNYLTARDLADRLRLRKYPRSWRGRCPSCDYAGDTFSVREGKGGKARVFCAAGCDADHLNDAIERIFLGDVWQPPERNQTDEIQARERKREAALRLWRGSEPVPGALADRYLAARGLPFLAVSDILRFRPYAGHPEGGRLPAMIALVQDIDEAPLAVHRTYLSRDGRKASFEPAKASLGPVWGGAVRLDPAAAEITIGEGIESSASAGLLLDLPAWAAINAGNLASGVRLPPAVRSIVIAADPDPPGERAAREAALRWSQEGRRVRIARPNQAGRDFNDLILERAACA